MRRLVSLAAALALGLALRACGSPATPQPISEGCATAGGVLSDSDLTVDLNDLGLDSTVELRVGETMTVGGGPCGLATYPRAATMRPVLEETAHHSGSFHAMNPAGYTDVTYRAAQPGRISLKPSGPNVRPGQNVSVVVLPAEMPEEAARRGTGTITITGAATGPVGTFGLGNVTCRRGVGSNGEWPIPNGMSFSTGGLTYQVAFGALDYGPPSMVEVARPVATGVEWYIAASDPDPRARPTTLVGGGWVSGPIRPLVLGPERGSISLRWWC